MSEAESKVVAVHEYKPIKKLLVANRGKMLLQTCGIWFNLTENGFIIIVMLFLSAIISRPSIDGAEQS